MIRARLSDRANTQLEAIFSYTELHWGLDQAEKYTREILSACEQIAGKTVISRTIPAEYRVTGSFVRVASHFIYWRYRADGDIDIMAILHQRMNQLSALLDLPVD